MAVAGEARLESDAGGGSAGDDEATPWRELTIQSVDGSEVAVFDGAITPELSAGARPPDVVERYYTRYYTLRENCEDTCVLRHSNGICVVTISELHPAISAPRRGGAAHGDAPPRDRVRSVQPLRQLVAPKGKRKRQGTFVQEDTHLAAVRMESGREYRLVAAVRGVLLEFNDALQPSPRLLEEKPSCEGYLAVILPKSSQGSAHSCAHLTSREQYLTLRQHGA